MTQLDLASYRRANAAFRKTLVCHIGCNSGFFVEMNYMVDAMLYCLAHQIKFTLYSDDANFGTGIGWTEYFMPFCDAVHETFHRKYNFHPMPSWYNVVRGCMRQRSIGPAVWKLKNIVKTLVGRLLALRTYGHPVLLTQDVAPTPQHHYFIPQLGIDCSYTEAYSLLVRMIWRFQPWLQHKEATIRQSLSLPLVYDGIQVRGGDKITETQLIKGAQVMQALAEVCDCVFILTDEYRQYQELQALYPDTKFLTLCQPSEVGYHHREFCALAPEIKKAAISRLLVSVDLLLRCRSFAGSITTGPSVFIMKVRHGDPHVNAVDCPRYMLQTALTLPIAARSRLSAAATSPMKKESYPHADLTLSY